jgi:hypothetical protein
MAARRGWNSADSRFAAHLGKWPWVRQMRGSRRRRVGTWRWRADSNDLSAIPPGGSLRSAVLGSEHLAVFISSSAVFSPQ